MTEEVKSVVHGKARCPAAWGADEGKPVYRLVRHIPPAEGGGGASDSMRRRGGATLHAQSGVGRDFMRRAGGSSALDLGGMERPGA
jgi:hypothetical protein